MKHWIVDAIAALEASLGSVPHELNELDWKHSLSPKKDRLTQHLSAFANYPNGGVLVFGIDDQTGMLRGITPAESESIIGQLANLGHEAIEPPVGQHNELLVSWRRNYSMWRSIHYSRLSGSWCNG